MYEISMDIFLIKFYMLGSENLFIFFLELTHLKQYTQENVHLRELKILYQRHTVTVKKQELVGTS